MRQRALFGVVIAALLLAACTPAEEPEVTEATETETETETETATDTETETATGGTLVVALDSDPGGLNPAITTSGGTHTASELMYNGLVGLDENLNPIPELAESWEITDEGRVYTFTLRDDVVWHDGTPFTSEDVKFSFEEVLTEFHSRTKASLGPALTSVDAPDSRTVVFNFDEPYAPLLLQLDVTEAPIVAKHIYEGTDIQENPANNAPVGTGPFSFVSYDPDAEVVVEANEEYFAGRPPLDEVVMRVIPDKGSQVIALEAGEVDWLWGVPGPDLERLRASEDLEFIETNRNPGGANCIMTVSFNLEQPMFADLQTREAIGHALDREAFLEQVQFGQGRVADAPISSGIPWAHAEDIELPDYDVAAAEALLEEAGWVAGDDGTRTAQGVEGVPDGTPLAFDFVHFPTFSRYGELFRTQLAEVGAEVELRPLEPPVFVETVFEQRDFDTNVISYCNGTDPEIGVRRMFDSSQIGPVPFSNAAAYSNEEVDALFEEGRGVVEISERTPIYREIQEIVAGDLPYLWLVETTAVRAFDARCSGFTPYGHFAATASCEQE